MSLKLGYLLYLHGEAKDLLEQAYVDDASPSGEAYRAALKDTINTYCTLFDKAAPLVAAFLEHLPFVEGNSYQNALLGLHILNETRAALDETLALDAELRDSVIGDKRTSNETDREIADSAHDFTKHHDLDTKERIGAQEREGIQREESDVRKSFYDNAEVPDMDHEIGHSARGTLDSMGDITIKTIKAEDASKKPDEEEVPAQVVERIEIRIPDFKGNDPIIVFRQSTEWMMKHIIMIATGSTEQEKFPRIAPIVDLENEPLSITLPDLLMLIRDLRMKVKELRPPMGDSPSRLDDLLERIKDHDPNDASGLGELVQDMLGRFGERDDDDKYGSSWKSEDSDD